MMQRRDVGVEACSGKEDKGGAWHKSGARDAVAWCGQRAREVWGLAATRTHSWRRGTGGRSGSAAPAL